MELNEIRTHEAEAATIGAVFLRPDMFDVVELEPTDFHLPKHRAVWTHLATLRREGVPFDPVIMAKRMEDAGHLGAAGGPAGLVALYSSVPSGENAPHYAEQVRTASITRRTHEHVTAALGSGLEGQELVERLWQTLSGLAGPAQGDPTITMQEACAEAFEQIQAASRERRSGYVGTAIATGLRDLDKFGGLRKGVVTILAGRPSHGKSSLARTIAANAAATGLGVHVFSAEDSRATYAMRQMADGARLDLHRVGLAQLTPQECQRLVDSGAPLAQRWLVDDSAGMSAAKIGMRIRRHKARNRTELVVVDYVQLLRERGAKDKRAEVEASAVGLVEIARQEDVALLVLSQLSRASDHEQRPPGLSDLRETGVLEQVASMVLFAHRPELVMRDEARQEPGIGYVLVRKNKNGMSGKDVKLAWDAPCATYRDVGCR